MAGAVKSIEAESDATIALKDLLLGCRSTVNSLLLDFVMYVQTQHSLAT
jgi:hypothetical protein